MCARSSRWVGEGVLRLVCVEGKAKGSQLKLEALHGFSIGRSAKADVPLDDPGVAELQARLYREPDGWMCFDMTTSGFVHNGERTQRAKLVPGDTLKVGDHVLKLISDEVAGAATATPPPEAAPSGAHLRATKGNDAGKTFPLGQKPAMILGRGVSTDITIWDIRASRAHCRVDCAPGRWAITDLSSSNGTYVNDARLKGTHVLANGDVIRIGSTHLEFHDA